MAQTFTGNPPYSSPPFSGWGLAYLDSDVRSCISGLARLRREDLEPGLEHLRQDLDTGAWHTRHQDLLDLDAIDAGLRLIVREGP